jgi:hypothetical protein
MMPTFILQVVVETEEDYSKKRVREALRSELRANADVHVLGFDRVNSQAIGVNRIFVRRDVDKQ